LPLQDSRPYLRVCRHCRRGCTLIVLRLLEIVHILTRCVIQIVCWPLSIFCGACFSETGKKYVSIFESPPHEDLFLTSSYLTQDVGRSSRHRQCRESSNTYIGLQKLGRKAFWGEYLQDGLRGGNGQASPQSDYNTRRPL